VPIRLTRADIAALKDVHGIELARVRSAEDALRSAGSLDNKLSANTHPAPLAPGTQSCCLVAYEHAFRPR
jgi:hypothetical protein